MDLLIRAGRNDHKLLAQLCAPAAAGLWAARPVPMTGVVVDAHVAAERSLLRETADAAGLPFLVDPTTTLLTDEQVPGKGWAALPFATPTKLQPSDLSTERAQLDLIDRCLAFQRSQGATILIPPYLYVDRRNSAWLDVNQALLEQTGRYLRREGIDLPVAPVFAASLHQFGPKAHWAAGLDRFLSATEDLNTRFVALSLSWSSPRKANYDAVALLAASTHHAADSRRLVSWRQGLYGAALTGTGAAGYETGPGHAEAVHYPELAAGRRPPKKSVKKKTGGAEHNVFLAAFSRSVDIDVARPLLEHHLLRGRLVCPDPGCCHDGATSMIESWREHAVRARHRHLVEIERMPTSPGWRLNKTARDAEEAAIQARAANEVLTQRRITWQFPEETFRHLARVADDLRGNLNRQAA